MNAAKLTRRDSGAVLAIVLIVILVAAAITAGWVAVLTSQAQYVETTATAAKRRIAIQNGTAIARQYVLTNYLPQSLLNILAKTASVPGGWGSVNIAGVGLTALIPLESFGLPAGWNHFDPANGTGFSITVPVTITSDAGPPVTRNFLLRSRPLALAGTLFSANRPLLNPSATTTVTGPLTVNGRALLWRPNSPNSYSLTATSINTPTITPPPSVAVTNFPFVPLTGGLLGDLLSGVPIFDGRANNVANLAGINSLAANAGGGALASGAIHSHPMA